ncbi:unnamed protein product [Macrosiphum euphorbiae]|uniref:Uncharacterized protein n=1 Tax=Macrosiphum euphorbiae TaxID=13131 RepID=A0AAV0XXL2_9HEMI|nr:unnamed protein product [Macrosiphum euphorbiae]CAI6357031.1 unnamed protein product [Macrosiphum euphorbiae]CAI6370150.1 unnamed protein product [Macrosiphum euphorbiae]CAI6372483.1 unnamed protein product [Macrosiphum euphorbiae]CAI6374471.1 unnamed protein product [Macrosiphum euphorbiae]
MPVREFIPRRVLYLMMLEYSLRYNDHVYQYTINSDGPTCLKNHMRVANEHLPVPYTTAEMHRIMEIITMTLRLTILVREIHAPTCLDLANLIIELIQAAEAAE